MELNYLNFANPLWLWALLAIPLIWIAYFLLFRDNSSFQHLEKFIDKHLLPHLLMGAEIKKRSFWKQLLLWTFVWSLLTVALAGPRWNFREIETFSKDQSLVILLDLSESMNATDIKPSRLVKARQKIEDLINSSKGVKIGLVAFAADPHMITPLTDDKETVRHMLPSLETDIIHIQGSRLSPALEMASTMLSSEQGSNKAILVISDGGYEDSSAIITAKRLAEKGIYLYTMGVATAQGAPIKDHEGNVIKKNGSPIISKLEADRLSEISKVGHGRYLNPLTDDEEQILMDLNGRAEAQLASGKKNQLWDERFYLLLIPVLPIMLWWFRRSSIFSFCFIFMFSGFGLYGDTFEYFKNSEQLAQVALEKGDYDSAANTFSDCYRKGVSYYKAGNYAEAEKMFRASTRPEVASSAGYNLGNCLAQQQKLKDAITAYEGVLDKWPDHTKAKENLELIKKKLEEQKQDSSDSENPDQKNEENKDNKKDKNKGSNKKDTDQNENKDPSENKDDPADNPENSKNSDKSDPKDDEMDSDANKEEEKQSESEQSESEQNENSEKDNAKENAAEDTQNETEVNSRSQEDQDADLWLNRITNDPKAFMKNKLYIESKKNGTTEGIDPW